MLKQVQHDIFHNFDIVTQSPRGEGRPFIPPAELGGILAYFDKVRIYYDIHHEYFLSFPCLHAEVQAFRYAGVKTGIQHFQEGECLLGLSPGRPEEKARPGPIDEPLFDKEGKVDLRIQGPGEGGIGLRQQRADRQTP